MNPWVTPDPHCNRLCRLNINTSDIHDHAYAPITENNLAALYLQLPTYTVSAVFKDPIQCGKPPREWRKKTTKDEYEQSNKSRAWYISMRFLKLFATNNIQWEYLLCDSKYSLDTDLFNKQNALDENAFLAQFRELWEYPIDHRINLQKMAIPMRNSDGGIIFLIISNIKIRELANKMYEALQNVVPEVTPVKSRWASRHGYADLAGELCFRIEPAADRLLQIFPNRTVEDIMKTLADEAVEKWKTNKGKTSAEIKFVTAADTAKGLVEVGRHPFNFYTTFITPEQWDKYMRGLGPEKNQTPESIIRCFTTASTALEEMRKRLEARAEKNRREIEDEDERVKAQGNKAARSTDVAKYRRQLDAISAGHTKDEQTGERRFKKVVLSFPKMSRVASQRDHADTQFDVMTAPINQLANNMGWVNPQFNERKINQLKNGLWAAEWTHVVGYAFGSLTENDPLDIGHTLQIPENLIIGTSETNSVMTRYEAGWQNLLRREETLMSEFCAVKKEFNSPLRADLNVIINGKATPVRYDVFDQGKFKIKEEGWSTDATTLVDQGRQNPPSMKDLRAFSARHSGIGYTMEYDIKVTTDSLLLGAGAEASFVFYPHMRPFFHPLESYMDTAIFLRLVKLANQALKDTMPEVTPPPTNTSFTSLRQKKSKNKHPPPSYDDREKEKKVKR